MFPVAEHEKPFRCQFADIRDAIDGCETESETEYVETVVRKEHQDSMIEKYRDEFGFVIAELDATVYWRNRHAYMHQKKAVWDISTAARRHAWPKQLARASGAMWEWQVPSVPTELSDWAKGQMRRGIAGFASVRPKETLWSVRALTIVGDTMAIQSNRSLGYITQLFSLIVDNWDTLVKCVRWFVSRRYTYYLTEVTQQADFCTLYRLVNLHFPVMLPMVAKTRSHWESFMANSFATCFLQFMPPSVCFVAMDCMLVHGIAGLYAVCLAVMASTRGCWSLTNSPADCWAQFLIVLRRTTRLDALERFLPVVRDVDLSHDTHWSVCTGSTRTCPVV